MASFYWLSGVLLDMTLILFCAEYFCISLNIFELCSGTQLSYQKEFDPIGTYFKDLLGGARSATSLELMVSHLSVKTFLRTLMPCELGGFPV